MPGRGPARPVRDLLENSHIEGNIVLDQIQLDAIFDNYPLLIDGLPGTGKTTAVSTRAALWLQGPETKRVLITC